MRKVIGLVALLIMFMYVMSYAMYACVNDILQMLELNGSSYSPHIDARIALDTFVLVLFSVISIFVVYGIVCNIIRQFRCK